MDGAICVTRALAVALVLQWWVDEERMMTGHDDEFLLCFDTVDWLNARTPGPYKPLILANLVCYGKELLKHN